MGKHGKTKGIYLNLAPKIWRFFVWLCSFFVPSVFIGGDVGGVEKEYVMVVLVEREV